MDETVNPYESPQQPSVDSGRWFRPAILPALLYSLGYSVVLLTTLQFFISSSHLVVAMVAGVLGVPGLAVVFVVEFRVRVKAHGIWGQNSWGLYRDVAWSSMVSARRINMAGLRFIRVASDDGFVLRIPLFLADRRGFAAMVCDLAGPGNPLAEFLAQRWPREASPQRAH